MTMNKEKVLGQLKLNHNEPMTAKDIEQLTGVDPRTLRDITHDLRMQHVPVCSGDKGYWLWNGEDKTWERTKARIRSQVKRELELLEAMEQTPLSGQQVITLKEREETWKEALRKL